MSGSEPFLKKVEEILLKKRLLKPERAILLGLFLMLFGGGLIDFANFFHIDGFTLVNGVLIWLLGFYFAFIGGIQWLEGKKAIS